MLTGTILPHVPSRLVGQKKLITWYVPHLTCLIVRSRCECVIVVHKSLANFI
jgi:hypothetical protein